MGLPPEKGLAEGAQLPAQILIVDDNHAARIAIRELLGWHGLQVCGDAKDGKEAEEVVELKPAYWYQVDSHQ